jgi:hypothetical protein
LPDPIPFSQAVSVRQVCGQGGGGIQALCCQEGEAKVAAKITNNSMRLTQTIKYVSSYSRPRNLRMFWESREDAMNMHPKKTMSRN